ncbi:MAG: DNA polymerase [Elusimicrobiales bacterium]
MSRKKSEKRVGCETCPFNGEIKVPGEGPEAAPLVFVGEAPGAVELRVRRPFVGPSGKLLETVFQQAGIARGEVYITNAVLCMSLQPVTPAARAVACCRERLLDEVRSRRPKAVVALGKVAAKALLGSCGSLKEERGKVVYSEELGAYVVITYHPAHVLRSPRLHRDLHADIAKARDVAVQGGVSTGVRVSYTVVSTGDELVEFLRRYERAPEVALDTETAGDGSLLCVGLSVEEGKAVVFLPGALRGREGAFSKWLAGRTCIGHNLKHDVKVLRRHGIRGASTGGDTLLQSYVLSPFLGGHGLKQLVRENLGFYEDYSAPVEPYMKKNQMELCPPEVLYRYNAHDAAFTLMLYHDLGRRLDDLDRRVLYELLYPASDALADMEELGVLVDRDYLRGLQETLTAELHELREEMQEIAGTDFNPNSPRQLLEVMYKHLKLPVPGRLSTDSKALNLLLRVTKHRFPELLLRYRERHKFFSTYVTKLLAVAGLDGRVRTTFNLHTTVTGRLSSSNPVNLQNQPRTPEARNAFVATPGYTLVECDLAQAEIRGWAWYSRDEDLKRAITESGVDVHTATACLMWGLKPEEVTKEQRTYGKRVAFGTLYGMDATTLASDLGISVQEAVELQNRFFTAYPRGKEWIKEQQRRVRETGVFVTPFGRKLRFVNNPNDPSEIDRTAVNYPIQSLCSDITLSALVRLHRRIRNGELGDTRLLVTVHDSILLETAEDAVEVARQVKEEMERDVLDGWMPFEAEAKVGKRWGELEEIAG